MDVDTAFLNSPLHDTVYIQQPPGFMMVGQEHLVCLLNTSLYGLKQASWAWYDTLHAYLTALGWTRSEYDNNLYFIQMATSLTILLIYVDDFYITGDSLLTIQAH